MFKIKREMNFHIKKTEYILEVGLINWDVPSKYFNTQRPSGTCHISKIIRIINYKKMI
jgi:hypothetical protein